MEGQIQEISRHMEGQESSGWDTHQGKSKKIWTYAHIPMYVGLSSISAYIREKGIKSCLQQIIGVFRDDIEKIKGTIMVHGVQRVYRGTGKAIKV